VQNHAAAAAAAAAAESDADRIARANALSMRASGATRDWRRSRGKHAIPCLNDEAPFEIHTRAGDPLN